MTVVPVLPATVLAYDENNIKPGWIALVLVIALAIATFLLWRSMNTQLGRIKAPHRADLPGARNDGAAGAAPSSGSGESTVDGEPTPDDDRPEDPGLPR